MDRRGWVRSDNRATEMSKGWGGDFLPAHPSPQWAVGSVQRAPGGLNSQRKNQHSGRCSEMSLGSGCPQLCRVLSLTQFCRLPHLPGGSDIGQSPMNQPNSTWNPGPSRMTSCGHRTFLYEGESLQVQFADHASQISWRFRKLEA